MRIAVLSDLHANLEALDAVLARARTQGVDATYVLGDIVGYGADPAAVIERVLSLGDSVVLAGNHDLAASGRFDTSWFNSVAASAITWTIQVLDAGSSAALAALEPSAEVPEGLLVHGSVADPAAEYVVNVDVALKSFEARDFALCFFGHTHLPGAFTMDEHGSVDWTPLADGEPFLLPARARAMLNPGSVGQPRDSDPRAAFMIHDVGAASAVVHRVAYDIEAAQAKIRAAGLPSVLADRLSVGR